MKYSNINRPTLFIFLTVLILTSCKVSEQKIVSQKENSKDSFINNPFSFKILKNYSDDYNSIGKVLKSESSCPLQKENIADPSFCFLRTVEYDGLTINIFSFDVLQSGTAEYIVTKNTITLINGLTIGKSKEEVIRKLGKPYKQKENVYIWKSSDLHNYLAFTIENEKVVKIRWNEEREQKYKNTIVWNTKYE